MAFERNTAHKCEIKDLNSGSFVKKEGFESSYVITDYGNMARVNLLGVVVDSEPNTIILDDGTGKITIRSFEPLKKIPELGDVVTIIGKPRVYNNEKYVVPEIIKALQNKKWIDYRKKELELRTKVERIEQKLSEKSKLQDSNQAVEYELKKEFEIIPEKQDIREERIEDVLRIKETKQSSSERITKFLKQNDTGIGVSIAELETLNIENFDKILNNLLAQGVIYEVKAGFVKLL